MLTVLYKIHTFSELRHCRDLVQHIWGLVTMPVGVLDNLTLSLPRVINFKLLLQPHQKYYITQYEELGFSSVTQMNDDYTTDSHWNTYTFLLKDFWECNFLILGMKGLKLLPVLYCLEWEKCPASSPSLLLARIICTVSSHQELCVYVTVQD